MKNSYQHFTLISSKCHKSINKIYFNACGDVSFKTISINDNSKLVLFMRDFGSLSVCV